MSKERELVGKKWNSTLNVYKYPEKKRKPIQRSAVKKKPGQKIRQVSKKRVKENREYSKVREEHLTEFPTCQAQVNGNCTHEATDIHHKKGRGKYLTDRKYFLSVCRSCHDYIELNPKEAKEKGWSVSRLTK